MSKNYLIQSVTEIMVNINDYNSMNATIQSLGKEVTAQKQVIAKIKQKNKQNLQKIANLEQEKTELKTKAKEISKMSIQNIQALYEELQNLKKTLETNEKQSQVKDAKIYDLEMILKDKAIELFQLNGQIQELKSNYQNQQLKATVHYQEKLNQQQRQLLVLIKENEGYQLVVIEKERRLSQQTEANKQIMRQLYMLLVEHQTNSSIEIDHTIQNNQQGSQRQQLIQRYKNVFQIYKNQRYLSRNLILDHQKNIASLQQQIKRLQIQVSLNDQNRKNVEEIKHEGLSTESQATICSEKEALSKSNYKRVKSELEKRVQELQKTNFKYKLNYHAVNQQNKKNLNRIAILQKLIAAQKP